MAEIVQKSKVATQRGSLYLGDQARYRAVLRTTPTERPFLLLIMAGKIRLERRGRGGRRQRHGASILRDEALGCWCLLPWWLAGGSRCAQAPDPGTTARLVIRPSLEDYKRGLCSLHFP